MLKTKIPLIVLIAPTLISTACAAGEATEQPGVSEAPTGGGESSPGGNGDEYSGSGSSETDGSAQWASEGVFVEDFSGGDVMSRFEVGLYHRDDHVVSQLEWPGDHPVTGPDDECGSPFEKRVVHRGERSEGFNDEWIYRCVPFGDVAKAHVMTSIGDTSGYSIGAFSPDQVFTGVGEVRWDVNQTDLGARQWTEVAIIPADVFDFQNLPCDIGACGLTYKEIRLDQGYRLDLLVEQKVIVELKAVEQITPVHEAQLLSYLKFSGYQIGLLFNFNVRLLKNGMRRFIMT